MKELISGQGELFDFRLKKNDLELHSADLRPLGCIKQQEGGTKI